MATIAIDTYKVVTRLQERGFTKEQAEALVAVAQEVDLSMPISETRRIYISDDPVWRVRSSVEHIERPGRGAVRLVALRNERI